MCDALSSRDGLFISITREGRCSVHSRVFAHLGNPVPKPYQRMADPWLSKAVKDPLIFVSPPHLLQCFLAHSNQSNLAELTLSAFSALTPQPGPPASATSPELFSSPRDSAPPCPTHQTPPTVSTLFIRAFPTFPIHPDFFHQLRPLSPIIPPPPPASGVAIPIAQMRMARLGKVR